MKRKNIAILITIIALVVTGLFFYYYFSRISFSEPLGISISGQYTHSFSLKAQSPLGNELSFFIDSSFYYYPYTRFYKSLQINFADIESDSVTILIKTPYANFYEKASKNQTFDLNLSKYSSRSTSQILSDLFLFTYVKFIYFFFIIPFILIIVSIYILRKRILRFFYIIISLTQKHKIIAVIIWLFLWMLVVFMIKPIDMSNRVITADNPDQVEYQSCAVNQVKGYGFLFGGKMTDEDTYKIFFSDEQAALQFSALAGLRRLDRFPAYSFTLALIYKVTGINPLAIKLSQLFLLTLLLLTIPLLCNKIWPEKGFWGGFIAIPLLLFYLIEYVVMFSPDLITVFFNFYILYFYILFRKEFKLKYIILLSVVLGLSFLYKASLFIYIIFLFSDLCILSIKNTRIIFPKLLLFVVILLSLWLPYNIWSINQSVKYGRNTREFLSLINQQTVDFQKINTLTTHSKKDFGIYTKGLHFNQEDLMVYDTLISPSFNEKGYIDLHILDTLTLSQKFIAQLRIINSTKDIFFLIKVYDKKIGALELNNEYCTDGFYHEEWVNDKESFYNNDNLNHKSDVYRVINFYYHNPGYFFKISHFKLISLFKRSFIVYFLILIVVLYTCLSFYKSKKKYFLLVYLSLLSFTILSSYYFSVIMDLKPYLLALSLFLIFILKMEQQYFKLPIIFILVSLYIFPISAYGNSRYMIYYDTFLYIYFGIFFYEIIKSINKNSILLALKK